MALFISRWICFVLPEAEINVLRIIFSSDVSLSHKYHAFSLNKERSLANIVCLGVILQMHSMQYHRLPLFWTYCPRQCNLWRQSISSPGSLFFPGPLQQEIDRTTSEISNEWRIKKKKREKNRKLGTHWNIQFLLSRKILARSLASFFFTYRRRLYGEGLRENQLKS